MTRKPTDKPTVTSDRLLALIDRMSRLSNSELRGPDLNPAQRAALVYLKISNRFSRKPSLVAEYLSATRGTVSQTLKALERKGMVEVHKDASDGRSISYGLTRKGHEALLEHDADGGLDAMIPPDAAARLEADLSAILSQALSARGHRSFGLCRTCKHHIHVNGDRRCALLDVPLDDTDSALICAEHA
ncbi:MarR family winged helix-turn-helix transcriptional regulator [uncultured Tateyamaria sp.]|uniref:MarR family winged helix-turn-helix transcriptional regulator n=1 Tax=uncultured Tateyamaria sp. TaxID=455651 RepID=UPI0026035C9D|nr:MarR family winged helix-turn-helix transcriptional regulator [uncultured Tateyamaria sp.]